MSIVNMKPFRKKGRSVEERFHGFYIPEPNSGCWLWFGGVGEFGHGTMNIEGRQNQAHRVSWELHNGPVPDDLWVLHRCDNPPCVNPEHLFLGTCLDNHHDMIAKGRKVQVIGEAHPKTKLTEQDVLNIRADTRPLAVIGADYGFDKQHVWKIKRRWYWKHI